MKLLFGVMCLLAAGCASPAEVLEKIGVDPKTELRQMFQGNNGAFARSKAGAREEVTYTLVEKNDKFEERVYPAWNWVCTDVEMADKRDHTMSFVDIVMYLQGQNAAGAQMLLTIPVMMQRKANGGGVMCAPIPAAFQATVPAPLNDQVRLVAVPQASVFVRRFGGQAKADDWQEHAIQLMGHLTEAGKSYRRAVISAMFSDPQQEKNRRNEVWLIKA